MISLDDETCIECGICADILPQFFEVFGDKVRVRPGISHDGLEPDAETFKEAK